MPMIHLPIFMGTGQIIPGLESAMEGLKVGDKRKLTVPAAQGYGEIDPTLKLAVPKSQFPPSTELEAGMRFQAEVGGEEVLFTVERVEDDKVHIDGNHPLAGKTLHFDVEVLSVRDATAEELSHGHAHGEDGHHHHDHGDHDHDHDDEE